MLSIDLSCMVSPSLLPGFVRSHWQRAVGESDSLIVVARAKIIESNCCCWWS
jgi:hypothetical protein